MKKNKVSSFRTINVIFLMLTCILLFFIGGLWIGSQEDYNEIIRNSMVAFIIKKSLMSMIVSFLILSLIHLIGRVVYKLDKIVVFKTVFIDAIVLMLISISTVLYHHY